MKPSARYSLILLCLISAAVVPPLALWFWLEPLTGDLTRLGWLAERDYGWSAPQEEFSRSAVALGRYDRYYDIVVVGDSFSKFLGQLESHPTSKWPNYLAELTGLSILVLHYRDATPLDIVRSEVFRKNPPRALVYEGIERDLRSFAPLRGIDPDCQRRTKMPAQDTSFTPRSFAKELRPRQRVSFDVNLGYARKYAFKAALRHYFGWEAADAKRVPLTDDRLFSSRESDTLLVYKDELAKAEWTRDDLDRAYCRIVHLENLVQANGHTRLVALLVPDKLTAYSRFVAQGEYRTLSALGSFLERPLPAPRLDEALQAAIAQGEKDVYLPNDTHWGHRGHQIAARTVAEFIKPPSELPSQRIAGSPFTR